MSKTAIVVVSVVVIAAVLVVGVQLVTTPQQTVPPVPDYSAGISASASEANVQRGQWLGFFSNIITTTGNIGSSYLQGEAARRAASGGTVPPNSVNYGTGTVARGD